jgi:hypothetical protein
MSFKIVLTGTGRCGTKWAAKVLTYAGVKCGHEFPHGSSGPKGKILNTQQADSSWLLAPYLQTSPYINKHTQIIHLTRHPEKVISSFWNIGFFGGLHNTAYYDFAIKWCPEILKEKDEISKIVRWYIFWNSLIEKSSEKVKQFKIECGAEALLKLCEIKIDKDVNREFFKNSIYQVGGPKRDGAERRNIILNDINNKELKLELLQMMTKYGY